MPLEHLKPQAPHKRKASPTPSGLTFLSSKNQGVIAATGMVNSGLQRTLSRGVGMGQAYKPYVILPKNWTVS